MATRREVEARAGVVLAKLDVAPLQDPVQALLRVSAETLALKDWLAGEFAAARAEHQLMLAELLGRSLDRASNLLVRLHGLGLEAQRARVEEEQARLLVDAMHAAMEHLGHDPWAPEVRAAVRRGFETVDAADAEARR